ncbi:PRC-barrel domain-containing protein [Bradyrhizobium sp. SYSU BS000235]|uniref:PRC-barrel domain-containing protein n=1 Tax=Bradyrhizobium sp. SYSU BS000235 TaxID=3411332 RepID=UPI003C78F877
MIAKYLATALVGTALMGGAAFAQESTTSTAPSPSASSSSTSVQQNLKGNWRASKLMGLDIYNESNEKLGDISEILLDQSGKVNAVVIGIGGFLGVGQHDIAVSMDKLKFVNEPVRSASSSSTSTTGSSTTTTGAAGGGMSSTAATKDSSKDNWYPDHAVMSGTKEQLKALPQFKYSDYQ